MHNTKLKNDHGRWMCLVPLFQRSSFVVGIRECSVPTVPDTRVQVAVRRAVLSSAPSAWAAASKLYIETRFETSSSSSRFEGISFSLPPTLSPSVLHPSTYLYHLYPKRAPTRFHRGPFTFHHGRPSIDRPYLVRVPSILVQYLYVPVLYRTSTDATTEDVLVGACFIVPLHPFLCTYR